MKLIKGKFPYSLPYPQSCHQSAAKPLVESAHLLSVPLSCVFQVRSMLLEIGFVMEDFVRVKAYLVIGGATLHIVKNTWL